MLCLGLPVSIVEQITGLWSFYERVTEEFASFLTNNPTSYEIYEWMLPYSTSGQGGFSIATYIFLLLIPGPLTLGISTVWLRVLRGHKTYADMVFSGFGNFARAILLYVIRTVFIILWSILLIIPGVVAYYRYSLMFFLLADDPSISPAIAMILSKHYMQQNKGGRFLLDLSFIGWFILAVMVIFLLSNVVFAIIGSMGLTPSFFVDQLVLGIIGAVVLAPLSAYHGVAAAEYYHRVTCQNPGAFRDQLQIPNTKKLPD